MGKVGKFAEEFFRRTLVVEEADRISWDSLFELFDKYKI